MNNEEVKALLYLTICGKDAEGDDDVYEEKIHIIKDLISRQQEQIEKQNKLIEELFKIIEEIASGEDIDETLEKYL